MLLSLQRFIVKSFFFPFLLIAVLLGITRPADGKLLVDENEIHPYASTLEDSHASLSSQKQIGEEFHEIKVTRRRRPSLTKEWHFIAKDEQIFNITFDKGHLRKTGVSQYRHLTLGRREFLHRYTPF